jgi:hypothetical protein
MFCRFCGATLPDDSTFCQSCGKSLATNQPNGAAAAPAPAPALSPTTIPAPAAPNQKTGMRIGFVLALFVVLGLVLWSVINQQNRSSSPSSGSQSGRPFIPTTQPRVMPLVDTAFTLNALQGMHWNFTVPANATDVRVEGTFNASGGARNDIEVYLLNDDEFVNWQNNHTVSTLYNSGRMTQGTLNAALPSGAGTYHLVFNNKFSLLSPKAVRASIRLHYSL